MPRVTLLPEKKTLELESDKSVYEQLKERNIPINSSCGGSASCAKCIVKVIDGDGASNDIPFEEKQLLGNVFHLTKERLSCRLLALGDMTLDISDHLSSSKSDLKSQKKVLRRTMAQKVEIENKKRELRESTPKKLKEGGKKRPKAFKFTNDRSDKE